MQADTFVDSKGYVSIMLSADTPLEEEILKKMAKQFSMQQSEIIEVTSAITIFNRNVKGILMGKKIGNGVIGKQEGENEKTKS